MAIFQNDITEAGRALHSHVQVGAVFTPTRIVLGSGYIPSGKTAKTMTDVVAVVRSLDIIKKERFNDGKAIFGGVYSNQDITENWYFRELALYAKAVYADGTEIPECLYSYGNAGDTADLMPAYSVGQPVERQMDIITWVGAEAAIDLSVDPKATVLREQMGVPGGVATLGADGILAEGQRPTAEQIGALPIAGGTLTGSILGMRDGFGQIYCDINGINILTRNAANDETNRRFMGVYNSKNSPLANAVFVVDVVNGTSKFYRLYGDHNKPTPGEIGAAQSGFGAIRNKNLLTWALSQGTSCGFYVDPSTTTEDLPGGLDWYTGWLTVASPSVKMLYAVNNELGTVYSNVTIDGAWAGWKQLATTEYVDNAAPGLVPASVE